MRLLLDIEIPENKTSFLMELLNSLPFLKVKQTTEEKALLVSEIKEAVEEMRLIHAGQKEARNAEDFLNEL